MAIKARQDEQAVTVTPEIGQCFEVIEAVMRFEAKREPPIFQRDQLRFLAASDAAVEATNPGSGGFHLIFFFQSDGSCGRQVRRTSYPLAACGDPHRPAGISNGFVRSCRTSRPFPPSTRSLVPGQCGCSHDLSERAF